MFYLSDLKIFKQNKSKNQFILKYQCYLTTTKKPEQYNEQKVIILFDNIIGSVLSFAVFAPQGNHLTIHPVLKAIGTEKEDEHLENDN